MYAITRDPKENPAIEHCKRITNKQEDGDTEYIETMISIKLYIWYVLSLIYI
jgi:hypothetical protein